VTAGRQRHALDRPARRGRPRDPGLDAAILTAATEMLLRAGIRGFSINEVARQAGVPKSTVYRRWRTRAELLRAALSELGRVEPPNPDTGSLRGDLVVLVRRRIELLNAREAAVARIGLEAREDHEVGDVVRDALDERRQGYRVILQRGVERGELRPELDFDAVLDLVFGTVWSRLVTQRDTEPGMAEELVDRALRGLAPRSK
jgi:AcrR family transcriptional regulator